MRPRKPKLSLEVIEELEHYSLETLRDMRATIAPDGIVVRRGTLRIQQEVLDAWVACAYRAPFRPKSPEARTLIRPVDFTGGRRSVLAEA